MREVIERISRAIFGRPEPTPSHPCWRCEGEAIIGIYSISDEYGAPCPVCVGIDAYHAKIERREGCVPDELRFKAHPSKSMRGGGVMAHSPSAHTHRAADQTVVATPACRSCGSKRWVAQFDPAKPRDAICMTCCGSALHRDGEIGHQWSLIGEGCDYCGISRTDAGPDYDWIDE